MLNKIKKNTYLEIISLLSLIVPCPPRFASGIIMVISLIVFWGLLSSVKFVLKKIETGNTDTFVLFLFSVFLIIMIKKILGLFSPILELLFGLALYFIPVSSFFIEFVLNKSEIDSPLQILHKLKECAFFSLKLLVFYLFREILAYGSISLPVRSGIKVINLFDNNFVFWATIPGGLILMATILAISIYVKRKLYTVGRVK